MIWIEKYRPKDFSEIEYHTELISILKSYTIQTMPNLIFHGLSGHGKKTLLYSLISFLYKTDTSGDSAPKLKKTEVITPSSKTIEVSFLESDEFIEINPSEHGIYDRLVVQTVIKQVAETKPMLNFFKQKEDLKIKLLVISNAENLSKDAQAALRRTIEKYTSTFRIILICNQISTLIEPIRSRFLNFRVPGYELSEMENICKKIAFKEGFNTSDEVIAEICKNSAGNLKRAIGLLEVHCFNNPAESAKRRRGESYALKLDWEKEIEKMVTLMKKEQSSQTLKLLRDSLYSLSNCCIPPETILLHLYREISAGQRLGQKSKMAESAVLYNSRLRFGAKSIIHLEGFCAAMLMILETK